MRTNIDLDETLLTEAFRHTSAKTKKELVHQALQEFVARHRRRDVRDLPGTVGIRSDYDYKALRDSTTQRQDVSTEADGGALGE